MAWWAVLAVVTAGPAGVAAAGSQPPAPGSRSAAATRVAVTTANVLVRLPPARARADLRHATTGATIVAGQENWTRRAARIAPRGWRAFQPARPRPACRGLATWWRRDTWRLVRGWARVVWPGAVPFAVRCVSVVILRHRGTGLVLPVVDAHMPPGVDSSGSPRPGARARVALYARGLVRVRAVAARVRDRFGVAVLAGDWNVSYPEDRARQWPGFPYAMLHRRWDTSWAAKFGPLGRPTHGWRRIDAVWWSESRRVRLVASHTIGRTWSDHNFLRVVLTIRQRG